MNEEHFTKQLETIYCNDNLVIYRPDEHNIMLADWSGFLTPAIAKEGCLAVLNCLEKYPATKVLNNNSKVTGHNAGAIDWVGKVWFPGMHERGTRFFAWVYSKELYTQIGSDQIISFNSQITIQTFYSFESAHQWLLVH